MFNLKLETAKLAVIGLGYVGLPLAVEFGKKLSVVGFDISEDRIKALRDGHDYTLEVDDDELANTPHQLSVITQMIWQIATSLSSQCQRPSMHISGQI